MEYFICENVFVPLRSAPSHKSEMLSQILFGERFIIVDDAGTWLKIKTLFDDYSGWIDGDHLQCSPGDRDLSGSVLNRSLLCYKEDKTKLVLEAGCEIFRPDFGSGTFFIGQNIYYAGKDLTKAHISTNDSLPDIAMRFINSPYIWGGRIPSGIDCSGLVQLAYKIYGKPIARDSFAQAEQGKAVDLIEESLSGDLAFFDNEKGRITHVGMIISRELIIHASGRVRIDSLDQQGIFRNDTKKYTHHLKTIRRLVS